MCMNTRIATRLKYLLRKKVVSSNSESAFPSYLIPDHSASPLTENDRTDVIDLFNYYVTTGFAAYPEQPVPYKYFDSMLKKAQEYPSIVIRDRKGTLAGFGFLQPHYNLDTFSHSAEVTIYFRPQDTNKGLGSQILQFLEAEGKKKGISCLLVSISSKNEGGIRHVQKHGYVQCGRFRDIGKKNGILFDTVWMEKII
jgi:L-amino acid N-acyltransferase YncA